jgi:hypothetical protein
MPTADTHTTAVAPISVRLSDGSAFYTATGGDGGPGGGLTDAELRATPLEVEGSVTVAGAVSVSNFPSVQAVSLAAAPTTPVTGTFWQATQPISGTVTANVGTGTQPVSGTFWQATQPVSLATAPLPTGAATETTLAAANAKLPASLDVDGGLKVHVQNQAGGGVTPTFKGRASTFRTPGRAGTAGQKIFAIHNATGSSKVVSVYKITVDQTATVIKAVTVLPPVIRAWKVTALPTNGTALTKVPEDSSLSTNSAVTVFGDASADGALSASALAAVLPAGMILSEEFAPRLITAVGYEMMDRAEFFADSDPIVLRPLEGIVIFLDYVLATQNPATDMWIVGCRWTEV